MRVLFLLTLLLYGCVAVPRGQPATYDIGSAATGNGQSSSLPLRIIEVRSPSWLATQAMQYRLAYSQGTRREAYAESRWAAPPAELVELALKRRIFAHAGETQAAGCRLVIDVDEFIQVFDAPEASRALLEVRAALLAPRGDVLLARRAFSQSQPAGADARSGVAAFGVAASELAGDVSAWLNGVASESQGIALRCRGG